MNQMVEMPGVTSRSDIEKLVNPPDGSNPTISEDAGAMLLRVLEVMEAMQMAYASIHKAIGQKADIEQVRKLRETLSLLDIPSLGGRVSEAEKRIRQVVGDNISIVSMSEAIASLKRNTTSLAQSNCYKLSGLHTSIGGDAVEEISHPVIEEGMAAGAWINTEGALPVSVKTVKCTDGKLTVTLSGDPGDDHVINYVVF